jgi:hypothetical protein
MFMKAVEPDRADHFRELSLDSPSKREGGL